MIGVIKSVSREQNRFDERPTLDVVVQFSGADEEILALTRESMTMLREKIEVLLLRADHIKAPEWVKKMEEALKVKPGVV